MNYLEQKRDQHQEAYPHRDRDELEHEVDDEQADRYRDACVQERLQFCRCLHMNFILLIVSRSNFLHP